MSMHTLVRIAYTVHPYQPDRVKTLVNLFHLDSFECHTNDSSSEQIVEEFDVVEINCSVVYRGYWLPMFHCQPVTSVHRMDVNTSLNNTFSHIFEYHAMRNTSITCKLQFNYTNTPEFNYTWKPPSIVAC